MKLKLFIICAFAALIGLPATNAFAQQNQIPIFVVGTFDYPGAGNSTTPLDINERGEIVGYYTDANNVRRGFLRRLNGSLTTIVAPNDTGDFTRANSINNNQTIVGDFFNTADNAYHTYLLNGNNFTQYDIGGPFSTDVYKINDGGNFVGAFGNIAQPNRGFVNIGGTATTIIVPEAFDSEANGINNSNRVVGEYRDGNLISHGFIRSATGALTNPVDFPGSGSTVFSKINNRGWIVGRYTDAQGRTHGLFRKNANTYATFDFPNAVSTSINGINDFGFVVGRYDDAAGVRHGFVAFVLTF